MDKQDKQGLAQVLRQNWYIILFLGGIIIAWTTLTLKTQATEKTLIEITDRVSVNEILDSNQGYDIKTVVRSLCIQNKNLVNIGKALNVLVVIDEANCGK